MKILMDELMIKRSLKRISHEIIEKNKGVENVILVGIKTRGEAIAKRLQENIKEIEGVDVPCISIDFSYWRDDVMDGVHNIEEIAIDFTDKIVILTDDVLYLGRTVRAAMDGIMHYGRAKMIELAVLVDRGHRELPIKADFVGKNIPTSEKEVIKVKFREFDNEDDKVLII